MWQVDPSRNLLYVRGQVPGPQGSFIYVRDAFRWKWNERLACQLPFPTYLGEQLPDVAIAASNKKDPYRVSCVLFEAAAGVQAAVIGLLQLDDTAALLWQSWFLA